MKVRLLAAERACTAPADIKSGAPSAAAASGASSRQGARVLGASILLIAVSAFFDGAPSSAAEQSIGGAEIVVNEVKGNLPSGNPVLVARGDGVYRDELVRTNTDSNAKLVLNDSTSLSIGPSSSIKLDRFVYAGPSQPGKIALNFAKGALLFATGNAAKEAYSITTPTAALGVRGTILKIASTPSKTIVDLVEGAVHVCMRSAAKRRCVDLNRPGQEAVVTVMQIAVNTTTGSNNNNNNSNSG